MSELEPVLDDLVVLPAPVVSADTPCRKCGYNLRGLSTDTRCPECGVAVAASVSGDLLRYCDPAWVRLLARGTSLIIASVVVMVVGMVVIMVLIAQGGVRGLGHLVWAILIFLAANLLSVIGSWLITAPDPSGVGEDRYGTARKIIRICVIVGIFNTLLNYGARLTPPQPAMRLALDVVRTLSGLVAAIGIFAQLQYLGKLADRIPDHSLASRANFLKKALSGSYLLFVAGTQGIALIGRSAPGAVIGLGCFEAIVGVALLVFGIVYLLMIERFGKRFREQATLGAQNWAAHASSSIPPG